MIKKSKRYMASVIISVAIAHFTQSVQAFAATDISADTLNQILDLYRTDLTDKNIKITPELDIQNNEMDIRMLSGSDGYHLLYTRGFLKNVEYNPVLLTVFFCHELGHAFAKLSEDSGAIAPEGAADYFAGADCLKRVALKKMELLSNTDRHSSHGIVCDNKTSNSLLTTSQCEAILNALMSFVNFNAKHWDRDALIGDKKLQKPKLNHFDDTTVEQTLYSYPSLQCRLDSLVSGLACENSKFEKTGNSWLWKACEDNQSSSSLSEQQSILKGNLPHCWHSKRP